MTRASISDPLELSYEDDVEPDPAGSVARVLTRVGVQLPAQWSPEARMVRQSDGLNDAWEAAYHQDASGHLSS